MRWSLIAAVVGWLLLGLAGYAVYTSLALPPAWLVPIVVGLPVLIGAGIAWFHYRRRRREVDEAWQVYAQRLQDYHTAQMRLTALEVLRESAEKLQSVVHQQATHTQRLAEHLTSVVTLREAAVLGLHILMPPWIKAVVTVWKHLQPIAQELRGHRDLPELLRRLSQERSLVTIEDWLKGIDHLKTDLRQLLVNRWMTPQHRRLIYYLRQRFGSQERMREWLEGELSQLSREAYCLLWRSNQPPMQSWWLLEPVLPPLSLVGDAPVVEVPDMVGRVYIGEARIEPT